MTQPSIDLRAQTPRTAVAAANGKVTKVTTQINPTTGKGWGKYIVIVHFAIDPSTGQQKVVVQTIYAHLSEQSVKVGQNDTAGQILGKTGSTGTSVAHLHFELAPEGASSVKGTQTTCG